MKIFRNSWRNSNKLEFLENYWGIPEGMHLTLKLGVTAHKRWMISATWVAFYKIWIELKKKRHQEKTDHSWKSFYLEGNRAITKYLIKSEEMIIEFNMCGASHQIYGCDTWTSENADRRTLETFVVWRYKKMLGIKWVKEEERKRFWRAIKRIRDGL